MTALPEQRGLVEQDDLPIYTFPSDYIERLWDAIDDVDPEFAAAYEELKRRDNEGSTAAE